MKFLLTILLLFFSIVTFSQIHTVKKDGKGDFLGIQEAIYFAMDGDTVLVHPGTYVENVDFIGKNITLGSLTLTTGDESYISQTIIDGDSSGSCILINSGETNAVVCGFSLTNGSGTNTTSNLYKHMGGGIRVSEVYTTLSKCNIYGNEVLYAGGGISIYGGHTKLEGLNVYNNHSFDAAGGVFIGANTSVTFDTADLCNIYLNYGGRGNDIFYGGNQSTLELIVDTFTILNPGQYHVYNLNDMEPPNIICNIQNAKIDPIDSDLYVSPMGDDSNSGLSPNEPLKSINYAINLIDQDTVNPNTIYLTNGTFSPSSGTVFPIGLRGYVNIIGESRDSTIIDVDFVGRGLLSLEKTDGYAVKNLTVQNGNSNYYSSGAGGALIIENTNVVFDKIYFTNNFGGSNAVLIASTDNGVFSNIECRRNYGGWAISMFHSQDFFGTTHLVNCIVSENVELNGSDLYSGGALAIYGGNCTLGDSKFYITNCEFSDNHGYYWTNQSFAMIKVFERAQIYFINNTIAANQTNNGNHGNLKIGNRARCYIINSILHQNNLPQIYMFGDYGLTELFMDYSIIEGGPEMITGSSINDQWVFYYDSTNMNVDPLWDGQGSYPYMLTASSPCIDAGTLNLPDSITLPETDLSGNPRIYGSTVDMGAYEYGPWVGVNYQPPPSPIQCQPNPFRANTTITYSTKSPGLNELDIYNIKGFKVRTLHNQNMPGGNHEVAWDGRDDQGNELPGGLYIVYLTVDGKRIGDERLIRMK